MKLWFTNHIFFITAVRRKLFEIRFSYTHCNFFRVCLNSSRWRPKPWQGLYFFKDQGRSLIKRSRKEPSTRAITCIAIFVWKGESRSSFSELPEKHSSYNHQSKFQIVCFDSSRILYCFVTSRSNYVWKRCTEISCKILLFSDKQPNVAGVLALTRKRLKTQGISCLTLSLSLSLST